jgi:hypothetical protein
MTSPNYATQRFGIDEFRQYKSKTNYQSLVSNKYPYLKYTWKATFLYTLDSLCTPVTTEDLTLKTFELPRWTTDTQVVNAYNHKTIVQTRLNWEPITISFYDQQNDAVDSFIWSFVRGQFDPSDASKAARHTPFDVMISMHRNSNGPLVIASNSSKDYLLRNCYIIDATHDTLDYSQSDVVLWTITLRYEDLTELCSFIGETPQAAVGIADLSPPVQISKTVDDSVVERTTPQRTPTPDAKQEQRYIEQPAVDALGNPLGFMERIPVGPLSNNTIPQGSNSSTGTNGVNTGNAVDRSRANTNLQNRANTNSRPMNSGLLSVFRNPGGLQSLGNPLGDVSGFGGGLFP